jgi:hypothetical protein
MQSVMPIERPAAITADRYDAGSKGRAGALAGRHAKRANTRETIMSDQNDFVIENGVLKEYNGRGGDVRIPAGVNSIGDASFAQCRKLTSVTLPAGLRRIGEKAFMECRGLTSVTIPEGVERICDNAFRECSRLESLTIPGSVKYIGRRAFYNCRSLTRVRFCEGAADIRPEAFACCTDLIEVDVCEQTDRKMLADACLYAALDEREMTQLLSQSRLWNRTARERFFETYMTSGTRAAMFLAEKRMELDRYAALRGMDADELRDRYLSDVGLDERGGKVYDLGNQRVTARLQKDLSFLFELPNGKTAKTLPKRNADPEKYESAKADFDEMRKSVRKIVKSRGNSLLCAFLSGKARSAADWRTLYLKNPLLRGLAELVVWDQGGKRFLLSAAGPIDCAGQPYHLSEAPVKVAHPMEMEGEEVKAWQKYFTRRGLRQPFLQIWEPVIDPETIREDRYEGCVQLMFRFSDRERHGIHSGDLRPLSGDVGFRLDGCELEYEPSTRMIGFDGAQGETYTLGKFRFPRYTRQVNHIVSLLDNWTMRERIRKDDASVADRLDSFTLAQITEFIQTAQQAQAVTVLALLLEYKNAHYADFDPMDEFTLES